MPLVILMLSGCISIKNSPPTITGTWQSQQSDYKWVSQIYPNNQFYDIALLDSSWDQDSVHNRGTYYLSGDSLIKHYDDGETVINTYRLRRNKMILYSGDSTYYFHRVTP